MLLGGGWRGISAQNWQIQRPPQRSSPCSWCTERDRRRSAQCYWAGAGGVFLRKIGKFNGRLSALLHAHGALSAIEDDLLNVTGRGLAGYFCAKLANSTAASALFSMLMVH